MDNAQETQDDDYVKRFARQPPDPFTLRVVLNDPKTSKPAIARIEWLPSGASEPISVGLNDQDGDSRVVRALALAWISLAISTLSPKRLKRRTTLVLEDAPCPKIEHTVDLPGKKLSVAVGREENWLDSLGRAFQQLGKKNEGNENKAFLTLAPVFSPIGGAFPKAWRARRKPTWFWFSPMLKAANDAEERRLIESGEKSPRLEFWLLPYDRGDRPELVLNDFEKLLELAQRVENPLLKPKDRNGVVPTSLLRRPELKATLGDEYASELTRHGFSGRLGSAESPPAFDRPWLTEQVIQFLGRIAKRDPGCPRFLSLTAPPFFGKSWFAWHLRERGRLFGNRPVIHSFRGHKKPLGDLDFGIRSICKQLRGQYGLGGGNENEPLSICLMSVLKQVGDALGGDEAQLIILDGLDESFGDLLEKKMPGDELYAVLPKDGEWPPGIGLFITSRPDVPVDHLHLPSRCVAVKFPEPDRLRDDALRAIKFWSKSRTQDLELPEAFMAKLADYSAGLIGLVWDYYLHPFRRKRLDDWVSGALPLPRGMEGALSEMWGAFCKARPASVPVGLDTRRSVVTLCALAAAPFSIEQVGMILRYGGRPDGLAAIPIAEIEETLLRLGREFFRASTVKGGLEFFHSTVPQFLLGQIENEFPRYPVAGAAEKKRLCECLARGSSDLRAWSETTDLQHYSLKYAPVHLCQARLFEDQLHLLKDTHFLDICASKFAREPELVLKHLAEALDWSVDTRNVSAAAWHTLEYARRIEKVRSITPIQAWLIDHDWEYAWRVAAADVETGRGHCYQAWLIRELRREGKQQEAIVAECRFAKRVPISVEWSELVYEIQETEEDDVTPTSIGINTSVLSVIDPMFYERFRVLVDRAKANDPQAAGCLDEAIQMIRTLDDKDWVVKLLVELARDLVWLDHLKAWKVLDASLEYIGETRFENALFEKIIIVEPILFRANHPRAPDCYNRALEIARKSMKSIGIEQLLKLALLHARARDQHAPQRFDEVLQEVREMKTEHSRFDSLAAVTRLLDLGGDPCFSKCFDETLRAAHEIESKYTQCDALTTLAQLSFHANQPRTANLFEQALWAAQNAQDFESKFFGLTKLATVLRDAQSPLIVDCLDSALQIALGIGNGVMNIKALISLMPLLATIKDPGASHRMNNACRAVQKNGDLDGLLSFASVLVRLNSPYSVNIIAEALRWVDEGRGIRRDDANSLAGLAAFLAKTDGKRSSECLSEAFRRCRELKGALNPREDYYAFMGVTRVLSEWNDPRIHDSLELAFEAAIAIFSDDLRIEALGELSALLAQGKHPKTADCFDAALKTAPRCMELYRHIAFRHLVPALFLAEDARAHDCLDEVLRDAASSDDEAWGAGFIAAMGPSVIQAKDQRAFQRFGETLDAARGFSEQWRSKMVASLYPSCSGANTSDAFARLELWMACTRESPLRMDDLQELLTRVGKDIAETKPLDLLPLMKSCSNHLVTARRVLQFLAEVSLESRPDICSWLFDARNESPW